MITNVPTNKRYRQVHKMETAYSIVGWYWSFIKHHLAIENIQKLKKKITIYNIKHRQHITLNYLIRIYKLFTDFVH